MSYEKWYALAVVSGSERKISREIGTRLDRAKHKGITLVCPDEEVVLDKGTDERRTIRRLSLPGYLLVHGRHIDNAALTIIRRSPGVLGFLGGDEEKPNPLPLEDVERILGLPKQQGEERRSVFAVGDQVRIIEGPMSDFEGAVSSVNESQDTAVVELEIFGRVTPSTLPFRILKRLK